MGHLQYLDLIVTCKTLVVSALSLPPYYVICRVAFVAYYQGLATSGIPLFSSTAYYTTSYMLFWATASTQIPIESCIFRIFLVAVTDSLHHKTFLMEQNLYL